VARRRARRHAAGGDALFEHTTRYVGSSPITKPLTIEVRIVKHGRRVGFVTAEAWAEPGQTVVTAQASFTGRG
jgi:acyl-coenzyme A thioesterase PaaI-like protein